MNPRLNHQDESHRRNPTEIWICFVLSGNILTYYYFRLYTGRANCAAVGTIVSDAGRVLPTQSFGAYQLWRTRRKYGPRQKAERERPLRPQWLRQCSPVPPHFIILITVMATFISSYSVQLEALFEWFPPSSFSPSPIRVPLELIASYLQFPITFLVSTRKWISNQFDDDFSHGYRLNVWR